MPIVGQRHVDDTQKKLFLKNQQIPKRTWRSGPEATWERFSNLEQGFKVIGCSNTNPNVQTTKNTQTNKNESY